MSEPSLLGQIQDQVKLAMKARDTARLNVLRLITAAVKQREVDDRVSLDDAGVLAVIEKMIKQRRESVSQFLQGKRQDLADQETAEIAILQTFMPEPLSAQALATLVETVLADLAAAGVQGPAAMGQAMAKVKAAAAGRADMGQVSRLIKDKLSA